LFEQATTKALTADDLEALEITELPEREALSLVNLNAAIPINAGLAANILSDNAAAGAMAQQGTPITQGT
jgi:hypothetical protein